MPLDIFSHAMKIPVGIGILVLIFAIYKFERKPIGQGSFKLGANRIASGLLVVVLIYLVLSYIQTYFLGLEKIELGHINQEELFSWVLKWGTYPYFITVPFMVMIFMGVGLPVVSVLEKYKILSILSGCVIAIIIATTFSIFIDSSAVDSECKISFMNCFFDKLLASTPFTVILTIGFGLGAGIPLVKMNQNNAT